jgi:hypothetical protein
MNVAFKIPYVYVSITKLCRTQAEVILNHVNPNVHGIGKEDAMHKKCKRLKIWDGQTYDFSAVYLQFQGSYINLLHKPALPGHLCIPCINVT